MQESVNNFTESLKKDSVFYCPPRISKGSAVKLQWEGFLISKASYISVGRLKKRGRCKLFVFNSPSYRPICPSLS